MTVHPPKTRVVKDFLWYPPILNWIKCNIGGTLVGIPSISACGGIYRDHSGKHLGRFLMNIGMRSTFMEDLATSMLAIETVKGKN